MVIIVLMLLWALFHNTSCMIVRRQEPIRKKNQYNLLQCQWPTSRTNPCALNSILSWWSSLTILQLQQLPLSYFFSLLAVTRISFEEPGSVLHSRTKKLRFWDSDYRSLFLFTVKRKIAFSASLSLLEIFLENILNFVTKTSFASSASFQPAH